MKINFTYLEIGLFLSFLCHLGAVRAVLSELFFGGAKYSENNEICLECVVFKAGTYKYCLSLFISFLFFSLKFLYLVLNIAVKTAQSLENYVVLLL